jgi:hypothetical protein
MKVANRCQGRQFKCIYCTLESVGFAMASSSSSTGAEFDTLNMQIHFL